MEFTVSRLKFTDALSDARKVIEPRTALAVLSGVKITAAKGKLELVSTNMAASIRTFVEAEVKSDGVVVLPGEKLSELISVLRGDDVTVSSVEGDNRYIVSDGKSNYRMVSFTESEFVDVDFSIDEKLAVIGSNQLKDAISQTEFAVQKNEGANAALCGIYFDIHGSENMSVAASDSRSLSVSRNVISEGNSGHSFIVPAKMASLIKGFCRDGQCEIYSFRGNIIFKFPNLEFSTSVLKSTFPNYGTILTSTEGGENVLVIDRRELSGIVRRATVVVKDIGKGCVDFVFSPGCMHVSASSNDYGTAEEEMMAAYTGESMKISLAPGSLLEMLGHISSEEVTVRIKNSLAPVRIEGKNTVGIVMPLRTVEV